MAGIFPEHFPNFSEHLERILRADSGTDIVTCLKQSCFIFPFAWKSRPHLLDFARTEMYCLRKMRCLSDCRHVAEELLANRYSMADAVEQISKLSKVDSTDYGQK